MEEIKCAIYTRKSTDEGLEKEFNTLEAQREAGENYVKSQKHQGWILVDEHYDDGGFSGGNMKRPALQRLFKDIELGKINMIVVYKIDRLTRSLVDFSKMVDIFDKYHCSFVSVTQNFNTSDSMGRLTLNMLLSFAQFEREIGSERVRDKTAASRKKGMWTGGTVPFGYRSVNKKLEIEPNEAEAVKFMFEMYIKYKSAMAVCKLLTEKGYRAFRRDAVLRMLKNPIYEGKIALVLWLPERSVATTLQLVEPDRLSNPNNCTDTKTLRGGVEIDRFGAPIAYHILKEHPGDYWSASLQWEHIPAYTSFGRRRVLHIHDINRIGQTRGKPILSSIMPMFKMLDHYERSELQAAIVNAMIAAFIETPMGGEELNELFGGSSDDYLNAKKDWQVKLEGGSIIPIFPGDKVAPFTPSRPNSAYGSFVENLLRHIGTGLNIPYELLLKDFSKTNYSSARSALLEAWRYFNGRRQWLADYWATPVYELWLEEMVNKGLVDAPDFYANHYAYTRCKWIGPGRGWVDPVKEAQACQLRMDIGLSTLENECASQGLDWEEVVEQRVREKNKLKEMGLINEDIKQNNLGDNTRDDGDDGGNSARKPQNT